MASAFKGRREDARLITGRGRYSDDWVMPGQLYASFRRSERAHALIRSIDVKAAEGVAGVVAVITGRDLAQAGFCTLAPIAPPPGRDGKLSSRSGRFCRKSVLASPARKSPW